MLSLSGTSALPEVQRFQAGHFLEQVENKRDKDQLKGVIQRHRH